MQTSSRQPAATTTRARAPSGRRVVFLVLAARPEGLPVGLVVFLIFWGGFSNGCWAPVYAQLKDSLPAHVSGTAIGFLNFGFFAGAAAFQQVTGVLLGLSGEEGTAAAYRGMFVFFLVSMAVAGGAAWLSREASPSGQTR